MINQLMFKKEKCDEEKLKVKLSHITRPANCDSLVTTKRSSFNSGSGLKPGFLTLGLKLLRLALSSQSQFYQKC